MPDFTIDEVEDAFVYYTEIIGVSEDVFWNAEIKSLEAIAENKLAYENWKSYEKNKAIERAKRNK